MLVFIIERIVVVNQEVCSVPVLNLAKHNLHCFGCLNGVVFSYWSKPYSVCKICGLNPMY